MTREKAQKVLEDITVDYENRTSDEIAELDEALDMAITALKTQEDDNISIHTVIDAINGMPTFVDRNGEKLIHQGLTKIKIKALASTTGHTDESSLVKSDTNDEDRAEDDQISRRAAIHTVHKIILGFFSDADGVMTDTEKTLLSVNKAICNALRAQGNEQLANNSPKVDSDSGDLISGKRTEERTETHARDYTELPWIPCKKQLPVEEGDYFVTVDPQYVPPGYRSTDVITWRDGKWVMADYFVLDSEGWKKPDFKVVELDAPIIAWMPLPKEYQEATDGTGMD